MTIEAHLSYDAEIGWLLSASTPGPAGATDVVLDHLRISLDAVVPARLVEVAIFDASPSTVALVGELLGGAPARAVAADRRVGTVEIEESRIAMLADLAAAELSAQRHRTMPGLTAASVVLAAVSIPAVSRDQLVIDRAWQALPALAALGRLASRYPGMLADLPFAHRDCIGRAVAAVTEVLRASGWHDVGSADLDALVVAVSGAEPETVIELATDRVPEYADLATPVINTDVSWSMGQEDLRPRIGELATAAFAGASAEGRAPGSVTVNMPLRPDYAANLPEIEVRLLTTRGALLAVAPLDVDRSPGELALGTCLIRVGADDVRDLEPDESIWVDIALAVLPPPGGDELLTQIRSCALRAGKSAVLAGWAGERAKERADWERCAALWRSSGREDQAFPAETSGRSLDVTADWFATVTARLDRAVASATSTAGSVAERVDDLRTLVRDLSRVVVAGRGVLEAVETLADLHLVTDEVSPEEAEVLLGEALQAAYRLGDQHEASRLLTKLANLRSNESE